MLTISTEQMEKMATVIQNKFVTKLAKHLSQVSQSTDKKTDVDFLSEITQARLKTELNYLMNCGIVAETDLAAALELIELFIIDENKPDIRVIMSKEETSSGRKLSLLWSLTRSGALQ